MTGKINQIPCQKIISGGQTGVDRGALDACLEDNFDCGGWCPNGRLAEDGKIPENYPLKEMKEKDYSFRTRQNVIDSDGTLIIAPANLTGGTILTRQYTTEQKKPLLIISSEQDIQSITKWLTTNNIKTINVAGPRLSEWNEGYLISFSIISKLINEIKKISTDI
ncbi:MAG: putative molybdenum carrier protein [Bacteroidota bacterium]